MTDNGSAYRSTVHAIACRTLGIRHLRTRPYRPHTNGKAERFIRTMLGEWAYGAIYGSSAERAAALDGWLVFYNWRRPHGSLSKRPPGTRLRELNNLAGSHLGHGRSLPGFMIPPGSRRSLTARRISTPRPPASASIHGRCARPMA
jgi:Integrase core domain